ncbi:hypothetical protein TNCV_2295131 [Trichonephila clavipes]|nr:hypothetical protein TNCV_2295131 [Trichonephila clavipes]
MVAQRLTQITPPAATPDQLWQRVQAALGLLYPKNTSKVSESMPRRVAAVISNNGGYSLSLLILFLHADWSDPEADAVLHHPTTKFDDAAHFFQN